MILRASSSLTALGFVLAALPANAQDSAADQTPTGDRYHDARHDQIVVTSVIRRSQQDVLSSIDVLRGEELTSATRPTIGETLQHTPGASATSFGPNASRPVLRGLQGERLRVLTNGIGTIDVSHTSVDHAVAVNPLLAERIEVLRGPQALIYGSSAIGGVVNVIDARIPNVVPDEFVHLGAQGSYASAAEKRSIAGSADIPLGGGFVAQLNGSWLKTDDLRIGGFALTPALRSEAAASSLLPPDPNAEEPIDFAANAALEGRLPNTASETWTAGGGFAYIDEGGSLGVAYSRYDSLYGVPVRYATLPGQEQEAPRIDVKQDRFDARAEITPASGFFDRLTLRAGFADYVHAELEPDGEVGTTFLSKGLEGRFELAQRQQGIWTGASGIQYMRRDFNVIGEEAFLPRNTTSQFGVFTVQTFTFGPLELEAGGRYERAQLRALPGDDQPQFFAGTRDFDAFSGSLGFAYRLSPEWRVGVNLAHAERAPAAEELFANGPHAATQSFEVGNPFFAKERSDGVEAILRGIGTDWSVELSGYYTRFNNYIFETRTGAEEDGLPVFQFLQGDADYYGVEAQAEVTFARSGNWAFSADGLADYVHATVDDFGPVPRIPPLRLLGGLGARSDKFGLRVEVEHVTEQDRVAPFETATPAFTLVNAELAFRPWGNERPLSILVSANNIFDVEARRHASVLKDYAPLAGRDIRVTVKLDI